VRHLPAPAADDARLRHVARIRFDASARAADDRPRLGAGRRRLMDTLHRVAARLASAVACRALLATNREAARRAGRRRSRRIAACSRRTSASRRDTCLQVLVQRVGEVRLEETPVLGRNPLGVVLVLLLAQQTVRLRAG